MTVAVKRPPLTPAQRRVLAFLVAHTLEHGIPPTLRDVCGGLGFSSTNGALSHLRALVRKGYLLYCRGEQHTYRLRGVRVVIEDSDVGQRLREAIDER